ncbi:MAG: tRNA (adenosine(37)-N6)-threonylcarbamoyltransferase complex dimerization subunit type 1 TsaB [Verrucomicrobiota bacterium]|jgi:tRNA threonylcarbamoyladenosine biosynthesis protein TsaB
MKILAVEFSSDRRSVAVADGSLVLGTAAETGGWHTHTFALIGTALAQAGWEREQIELIAVGLGPGSYTGIRAAIALAQGWQLGLGVRLTGLSSVECLATQLGAMGATGCRTLIVDAQRNEFYRAVYEITTGGVHEVELLRIVTRSAIEAGIAAGAIVVGPDADRWFPSARALDPDAAALARLAANRNEFLPGEKLEPIYLRETSFVKAPRPRVV